MDVLPGAMMVCGTMVMSGLGRGECVREVVVSRCVCVCGCVCVCVCVCMYVAVRPSVGTVVVM